MRGEHKVMVGMVMPYMGSSPHARGTHLQSVTISRDIWIRHHPFPSLPFSALFAESPTSATPLQRTHQRIFITKCKDSGRCKIPDNMQAAAALQHIAGPLRQSSTTVSYGSPLRQSPKAVLSNRLRHRPQLGTAENHLYYRLRHQHGSCY